MPDGETPAERPQVSIIVPARNEEACLAACLRSLLDQQAVRLEVIVVDDDSTDRTREIAGAFAGVTMLDADPLPPGWGGKSNACLTGARRARGEWLLFTDADTVHLRGSLARSLAEARNHGAALLSYSPAQELHGLAQMAVMPVIFAELASVYRPAEINDPLTPAAAANGQYLLITREAYEAVGGHAAVARSLLEDVELARAVKRSGFRIRFRYSGDAVSTRMYRSFAHMREGWTKNLALLFSSPLRLAGWRAAEFILIVSAVTLTAVGWRMGKPVSVFSAGAAAALLYAGFRVRIAKAHAGFWPSALAIFGLPLFAYLLLRSRLYYKYRKQITWKGRHYSTALRPADSPAAQRAATGAPWST